jgi:nucleoside permease NupC
VAYYLHPASQAHTSTSKELFMIETGLAVFLGLAFIFAKLKRKTALRLLSYDLLLDVGVTLIVLAIHWGSFSGVMAATIAGLLTSVATSAGKRLFGHMQGDYYYPGVIRLEV